MKIFFDTNQFGPTAKTALTMANINTRKRAAHRRRVQAALQDILNDPGVMPNADCRDLVVSVSRIE